MKAGWMVAATTALLAACMGAPLPAQQDEACNPCWISRHSHNGDVVEIRMQGSVELTDDESGVRAIRPGGYLLLAERGTRRPDRRVLYTPGAEGSVRLDFRRAGSRREPDAGDLAWIREMLRRGVEDGLNAEGRAEAIHRRGGVSALLNEAERLDGDGVRRTYYARAIESSALRPAEAARVLRHAGREMESDGDLARFLRAFAERHGRLLADEDVRDAFFDAAASLRSDGDRARVLIHVLEVAGDRPAVSAGALHAARGMGSNGDKTRVLTRVPRTALASRGVADAYRSTLQTIRSEGDCRRAHNHLASPR
ncbi:hypothetical protein [Longimicrobium sp.]|uniref:hypothetical protein n=1 Tax=Longimicrobium sp. TaxID=2029185 RepID=UPI003B3ABF05